MRDRPRHNDTPPESERPDRGGRDGPHTVNELLRLVRGDEPTFDETVARIKRANADQDRKPEKGDRLPNPEHVDVPPPKFAQYSMKAEHPENRGKARAWEALGYDVSTPESREIAGHDAIQRLRAGLPDSVITDSRQLRPRKNENGEEMAGGSRVTTRTPFTGPNGKDATMATAWHGNDNADRYGLVTVWAELHKEGRDR
jgi:hypothetical protein